jgi:hypothetical protein
MGRPTLLTRDLIDRIADHVEHGAAPLHAALAEGVSEAAWYDWLKAGRRDRDGPDDDVPPGSVVNPIYLQLVEAVDTARARFAVIMPRVAVTKIRTASDAVMILERHPDTRDSWGARRDSKVTHEGTLDVTVHTPATEAELRDRLTTVLDFLVDMPAGVDNDTEADEDGATHPAQETTP